MKLRVVTYNIRLGIQEGIEAIADVLAEERADIIALQEVGFDWTMGPSGDVTQQIADLLGPPEARHRLTRPHCMHVAPLMVDEARYGHALISWLPMTSCGESFLPCRVDEPRSIMTTNIELPDRTHVTVYSTHLSHIGDRPAQGEVLVEQVGWAQHPLLIMGDLNATHEESFVQSLLEKCDDADPLARPTFPAEAPSRRIDYILARDGVLTDVVVGDNATASDHRYVAATWSLS